jgi:hypothetical protein
MFWLYHLRVNTKHVNKKVHECNESQPIRALIDAALALLQVQPIIAHSISLWQSITPLVNSLIQSNNQIKR